ncbi:hypothetical protein ACVMAJ_004531 [Bradyrhizobium sp. USDA 4448]
MPKSHWSRQTPNLFRGPALEPLVQDFADLLQFIWSEIKKAPGEQLALQEMTLYVLRRPHAEHMAREKDHEFLLLYADWLRAAMYAPRTNPGDHGARQLHLHELRFHAQPVAGGTGRPIRTGDGEFDPRWSGTSYEKPSETVP